MLNNWFLKTRIKNFFKSGLFLDFFLKKIVLSILNKLFPLSIFFLEKHAVEFIFKKLKNCIPIHTILQKNIVYKPLNMVLIFLNLFIFVSILIII